MLKDILVTERKLFIKVVFIGFKVIIDNIKVHISRGNLTHLLERAVLTERVRNL